MSSSSQESCADQKFTGYETKKRVSPDDDNAPVAKRVRVTIDDNAQDAWRKQNPRHIVNLDIDLVQIECFEYKRDKIAREAKEAALCAKTKLPLQKDVVKERLRLDALREELDEDDPKYPPYSHYPANGVFVKRNLHYKARYGPPGRRDNPELRGLTDNCVVSSAGVRYDPLGMSKENPRAHLVRNRCFYSDYRSISLDMEEDTNEQPDPDMTPLKVITDFRRALNEKLMSVLSTNFDFAEEMHQATRASCDEDGREYTEKYLLKKLLSNKNIWPKEIGDDGLKYLSFKQRLTSRPEFLTGEYYVAADRAPTAPDADPFFVKAYNPTDPKKKPLVKNPRIVVSVKDVDAKGKMVRVFNPTIVRGYQVALDFAFQITRDPLDTMRFQFRRELQVVYLFNTAASAINSSAAKLAREQQAMPTFDCAVSASDAAAEMARANAALDAGVGDGDDDETPMTVA